MNKQIIVNADGYGFTPGCNKGIVQTFEAGLVRSTSCTPNFGHLNDLARDSRRFPDVSFGLHVNLSVGAPVSPPSKVPSLVNRDGTFHGPRLLTLILSGRISYRDVVRELDAQVQVMKAEGVKITHIDGHQNKHLYPMFFRGVLQVARQHKIPAIRSHRRYLYTSQGPLSKGAKLRYYVANPVRVATHFGGRIRTGQAQRGGLHAADRLITPGYADDSHKSQSDFWFSLARTLPAGTSEIYCHPAYPDDLLRANAKYVDGRAIEVAIMTDPTLKAEFEKNEIRIMNFRDLLRGGGS